MVLLILESLGSTELVFILVMALVFFGPRKLPQISRKLGKSLAEFRRASEDFKRTWDKEVTLEEAGGANGNGNQMLLSDQANQTSSPGLEAPAIGVIAPERVVARDASGTPSLHPSEPTGPTSTQNEFEVAGDEPKHSPKSDWL